MNAGETIPRGIAGAIPWIAPVGIAIVAAAVILWIAGLRLFLGSDLSPVRKTGWTVFLIFVGIGIGILLPLPEVLSKFLPLTVILPLLGVIDVFLLRSGRGLSFWIRACGFEICTVFGVAAAARWLLDLAGAAAWLSAVR